MDYNHLLEKVEALVQEPLALEGFQLVERELIQEYGRWVLRFYIEKTVGELVTIADCERASRQVEALLDVEEIVPFAYVLEVSSPGSDRPLRHLQDFERFAGQRVQLKTKEAWAGFKSFTGTLQGVEGDQILIHGERENYKIPFHMLAKARIKP